jgi:hypothetical protein
MVMQVVLKRQVCIFFIEYKPYNSFSPCFFEAAVACRYRWFSSSLIILAISEALFSSNNLKTAVSCLENFCDLKQLLI